MPVSAILLPVCWRAVHGPLCQGRTAAVVQVTIRGSGCRDRSGRARRRCTETILITKLKLATTVLVPSLRSAPRPGCPCRRPPRHRAGEAARRNSEPPSNPGPGWTRRSEPADISGRWQDEDCGQVELKLVKPGAYEGTYTDTFRPGPGTIALTWSAEDRRFNGTWAQGKDRYGTLSVRPDGREIRGAFATDPNCKIRPGKPALADLRWVRSQEKVPAKPATENPPVKNRWEKRLEDRDLTARQRGLRATRQTAHRQKRPAGLARVDPRSVLRRELEAPDRLAVQDGRGRAPHSRGGFGRRDPDRDGDRIPGGIVEQRRRSGR